jgi:NAD(P)-dependent dehydrogenase (short-subunit alcohol dehydrogenase family)
LGIHGTQGNLHHRRRIGHRPRRGAAVRARRLVRGYRRYQRGGHGGNRRAPAAGASSIHKLDVRDRAAWDAALADFARAAGGGIDVVFNNAGIPIGGQLADLADEVERTLDINLRA